MDELSFVSHPIPITADLKTQSEIRFRRACTLRVVSIAFFSLLLQACTGNVLQFERASQKNPEQELTRYVSNQDRLYRVAAPLLVKNAPLCKSASRHIMGFTAKNQYSYSADLASSAKKLLKLDDRLQIISILEGSGAERAGVKRGDIFLKVQNQPIPTGINAETDTARLLSTLMTHSANLQIAVERNKLIYNFNIPLTLACAFTIELGNSDVIHAFNDGRRILITRGMVDFLSSDAELAVIAARELAHGALKHTASLQMTVNATRAIDELLPLLRNSPDHHPGKELKSFSASLDQAADRVAIAMLIRAGYDPDLLPLTLQKLASIKNSGVIESYTAIHPLSAERLRLMQEIITQVKQKSPAGKTSPP